MKDDFNRREFYEQPDPIERRHKELLDMLAQVAISLSSIDRTLILIVDELHAGRLVVEEMADR